MRPKDRKVGKHECNIIYNLVHKHLAKKLQFKIHLIIRYVHFLLIVELKCMPNRPLITDFILTHALRTTPTEQCFEKSLRTEIYRATSVICIHEWRTNSNTFS